MLKLVKKKTPLQVENLEGLYAMEEKVGKQIHTLLELLYQEIESLADHDHNLTEEEMASLNEAVVWIDDHYEKLRNEILSIGNAISNQLSFHAFQLGMERLMAHF